MGDAGRTIWQELAATALVGVERRAFSMPAVAGELGALLGAISARPDAPERALLAAAGVVAIHRRAGSRPDLDTQPLPEPSPDDERTLCLPLAAQQLERILAEDRFHEVLPEWLEVAAASGRLARPEQLVPLLEFGRTRREPRRAILAVIGNRGRWLASRNADWKYAAGGKIEPEAEVDWQTAGRDARLALLAGLRAEEPARARELVTSTWDQESPADRASFLEAFEVGLSLDDEALLEAALDDRRAEVRRASARLLSSLAGSRLCRRMIDRVTPLIRFVGAGETLVVQVTLPDSYSNEMGRDGVEKKVVGKGEKGGWLSQMLGVVPPQHWCGLADRSPSDLLKAAERSEEKEMLLRGWAEAAGRHRDPAWLEAVIALYVRQGWNQFEILTRAFSSLPRSRQEAILTEIFERNPDATQYSNLLLGCIERPWSMEMSRAVIRFLERVIEASGATSQQSHWVLTAALRHAGPRMMPSCAEELEARIRPKMDPAHSYTIQPLDEALHLLRFRHEMLSEFRP